MSPRLIDRIANASFVIGLFSAAGFSLLSGKQMSGRAIIIASASVFVTLIALEMRARYRASKEGASDACKKTEGA